MSHLIVNQKLVEKIMRDKKYKTNNERDQELLDLYNQGKFKGGPERIRNTIDWFIKTYPLQYPSFELFLKLK